MKHQAIFDLINSEHPEDIELGFLIAKQQNISIRDFNFIFGGTMSSNIKDEIAMRLTDYNPHAHCDIINREKDEDFKASFTYRFITKWKEE